MKRHGSTESIRKLFETVSATLRDKLVGGARSFQTVPARFVPIVPTRKHDPGHYQVRMQLLKPIVRFLSTIYVQFHISIHGTVRS